MYDNVVSYVFTNVIKSGKNVVYAEDSVDAPGRFIFNAQQEVVFKDFSAVVEEFCPLIGYCYSEQADLKWM